LPKEARRGVAQLADKKVLGGVSLGRLYPQGMILESCENGLLVR
jgi:glycine dehydrogenase subunit 1